MAAEKHIAIFKKGRSRWNNWRKKPSGIRPDLSHTNFHQLKTEMMNAENLTGGTANATRIKPAKKRGMIDFRGWNLTNTNFDNCYLELSDFRNAELTGASFQEAILQNAEFSGCTISGSDMRKAILSRANFNGAKISNVNFNRAMLAQAHFEGATIKNCLVFGCSAWDIYTDKHTVQEDLYLKNTDQLPQNAARYMGKGSAVTVSDIKTAAFIYSLMESSEDLARNIDEATNRVVLLLGKFRDGGAERLNRIKSLLADYGLIPIKFDFEKPELLNLIETITIIAGLSKFIIADLSGPSVPAEIERITSSFYKPILLLMKADEIDNMYAMVHDQLRNENILFLKYKSEEELHKKILKKINEARQLNVQLKRRGKLSALKIKKG